MVKCSTTARPWAAQVKDGLVAQKATRALILLLLFIPAWKARAQNAPVISGAVGFLTTTSNGATAYQPVLYLASCVEEIVDVVGWFFATCDDDSIAELRSSQEVMAP